MIKKKLQKLKNEKFTRELLLKKAKLLLEIIEKN